MANDFDDFDTEIQCDELIPSWYEDDDAPHGLTADERDERGLYSQWRDECFSDAEDGDDDELCAVFGADDPDNYLGAEYEEAEGGDDEIIIEMKRNGWDCFKKENTNG